jgi:hypothetical protein
MKKQGLAIIIFLTLTLLTACGEKSDVGENLNEYTVTFEETGTKTDGEEVTSSLKTTLNVPDEWSDDECAVGADEINNAGFAAEITVPDTGTMSVFSASVLEFTPDTKKALLNTLCDDGTVYIYDQDNLTKSQIEAEEKYTEYTLKAEGYAYGNNVDEDTLKSYEDKIASYEQMYNNAPDTGKVPDTYEEDYYVGNIGEQTYLIEFYKHNLDSEDSEGTLRLSVQPYCANYRLNALNDENDHIYMYTTNEFQLMSEASIDAAYGEENEASLTEEDAKAEAVEYAEKLGFSGYSVADVFDILWTEKDGATGGYNGDDISKRKYGYSVFLTKELDGVNMPWDLYFPDREYIEVALTDEGLLYFEAENPSEITGTETGNVSMLDFSDIQSVFKETLEKWDIELDDFHTEILKGIVDYQKNIEFNRLELTYMRVTSDKDNNECKIIPVWRLEYTSLGDIKFELDINAIDGSLVNCLLN